MSNLYYGYRGDNSGQRGAPSHSSQQPPPHLPPKESLHHSPNLSFPLPSRQSVQLQPSATASSQQPPQPPQPPIGFPTHHAWAPDQPTHHTSATGLHAASQHRQQQQQQQQQQPQPALASSFPPVQTSQPRNPTPLHHGLANLSHNTSTQPRSVSGYDDAGLLQSLYKSFEGAPTNPLPSSANIRNVAPIPSALNSASPPPNLDTFSQLRPGANANVFDPSDFPSLGGAINLPPNGPALSVPHHAPPGLIPPAIDNSSVVPPSATNQSGPSLNALGNLHTAVNGLPSYHDLFSISPYGDRRAKAVDALTGSAGGGEFKIQNEDFPALGGQPVANPTSNRAQSPSAQSHLHASAQNQHSQIPAQTSVQSHPQLHPRQHQPQNHSVHASHSHLPSSLVQNLPMAPSNAQRLAHSHASDALVASADAHSGNGLPASSQMRSSQASGSRLANGVKGEPATALTPSSDADKFGMKALLPVVLPAADGKTENMLTVGLDLTGLGLNLNSSEALYKTFDNPWDGGQSVDNHDDHPLAAAAPSATSVKVPPAGHANHKEGEFKLPTCYYMQPPSLRSSHFNKFQLETLFYIFYNMPRDVLQLLAAGELYDRKWRFHKDLKLWFSCDVEVLQCVFERSGYVYFDIKAWERRPFHDANHSFIQGLMTEEEILAINIPSL